MSEEKEKLIESLIQYKKDSQNLNTFAHDTHEIDLAIIDLIDLIRAQQKQIKKLEEFVEAHKKIRHRYIPPPRC